MVKLKSEKRGAEMALNTIVIALLVIIVMVVIIFVFTSNVGKTNEALSDNSATTCSLTNPAISILGYNEVRTYSELGVQQCDDSLGWKRIIGVSECCGRTTQDQNLETGR